MKALSLYQPWAQLCVTPGPIWADGKKRPAKRIETRSWQTKFRGFVLIHASKSKEHLHLCSEDPFQGYLGMSDLAFGSIIGAAQIVEIRRTEDIVEDWAVDPRAETEQQFLMGNYDTGRFGWYLENPVQFKTPIPCRGSLSLWTVPESVQTQLTEQIEIALKDTITEIVANAIRSGIKQYLNEKY
jgi:hypothetical protein